MNERQQTALAHHCRLGFETGQRRFCWLANDASVVLTVNSGYE